MRCRCQRDTPAKNVISYYFENVKILGTEFCVEQDLVSFMFYPYKLIRIRIVCAVGTAKQPILQCESTRHIAITADARKRLRNRDSYEKQVVSVRNQIY